LIFLIRTFEIQYLSARQITEKAYFNVAK